MAARPQHRTEGYAETTCPGEELHLYGPCESVTKMQGASDVGGRDDHDKASGTINFAWLEKA